MEISGMLSELKQNILLKDYPELNNVPFDIHLIDGLPTVLAPMSKASQEYTAQSLQKMAIISRNRAVADLTAGPFKHFNGLFACLIWVFVHLFSLINLRNKVTTFFNWLYAYATKNQPLRMIVKSEHQNEL